VAEGFRLVQGAIEESNVALVKESIDLVDIHRRYEAYMKVLETFTAQDKKVVEEIGQQA
jgi:flagellar basal body rod protein FlgG